MSDYIEREAFAAEMKSRQDAAKEWLIEATGIDDADGKARAEAILSFLCEVKLTLEAIPAADVRPVRHGRWIWNPDGMDWGLGAWCCSECESKAETWWANDKKYNPLHCSGGHFCGNCGALMDKDGDGDV